MQYIFEDNLEKLSKQKVTKTLKNSAIMRS